MTQVENTTYLRRLAKEVSLQAWTRGAYYCGLKITRARFSSGAVLAETTSGTEVKIEDVERLQNGYGQPIDASHWK